MFAQFVYFHSPSLKSLSLMCPLHELLIMWNGAAAGGFSTPLLLSHWASSWSSSCTPVVRIFGCCFHYLLR